MHRRLYLRLTKALSQILPAVEGRKVYHHAGPQTRAEVPPEHQWPKQCGCGYQFLETDEWQVFSDHLYRRQDTGVIVLLRDAGPGAMWHAEWLSGLPQEVGPDGLALMVNCPNNATWHIDGRANNCDSPCEHCGVAWKDHDWKKCEWYKDAKPHKCWVRHGTVPKITVDKSGVTCGAGAGSIQAGDYHGFMKNGIFT